MKIYLSKIENIRMNFKHLRNYQTSYKAFSLELSWTKIKNIKTYNYFQI